jgi:hypothetical protein
MDKTPVNMDRETRVARVMVWAKVPDHIKTRVTGMVRAVRVNRDRRVMANMDRVLI